MRSRARRVLGAHAALLLGQARQHALEVRARAQESLAAQWTWHADNDVTLARLDRVLRAAAGATRYEQHIALLTSDRNPWDRLRGLPVIAQAELREHYGRFVSEMPDRVEVGVTSGTTGTRTSVIQPSDSRIDAAAVERRLYTALGLPDFFTLALVTSWPGRGRVRWAFRDWRIRYVELGARDALRLLRQRRTPGDLLLTSPDVLSYLAEVGAWDGVAGVASSFEVADDKATAALASSGMFNVGEEYLAADVTVPIAFRYPGCIGMHVNADYVLVEVEPISDDPGRIPGLNAIKTGRIIVTDLMNIAMPVVRYRIGDVGTLEDGRGCGCGRPFPLLSIYGREIGLSRSTRPAPLDHTRQELATLLDRPFLLVHLGDGLFRLLCDGSLPIGQTLSVLRQVHPGARLDLAEPRREHLSLMSTRGIMIDAGTRYPLAKYIDGPVPAGWRQANMQPAQRYTRVSRLVEPSGRIDTRDLSAAWEESALPSAAGLRKILRDRYAERGMNPAVRIADTGSLAPVFRGEQLADVTWGVPASPPAAGTLLLMNADFESMVVHRVIDSRAAPRGWMVLQSADAYEPGDPYGAFWVSCDDVLGQVTGLTDPSGGYLNLDTRTTRALGRMLASVDRLLWFSDTGPHRHLLLPLALLSRAVAAQIARQIYRRIRHGVRH